MKRNFIVQENEVGMRLDLFLAAHNDDLTRTFIKSNISSDNVTVNGEIVFKSNYRVKADEKVDLSYERETPPDIEPQDIDLDVVYEDDDLVVINKPSGMVVHPATGNYRDTLVNALIYKYKDIGNVGERIRSGLIHRLDKDTSGLILVAKTNRGLWHYSKMFAERNVKKSYLLVSKGAVSTADLAEGRSIEIQNNIGRNPKNRQKYSVVDKGGKFAHTVVRLLTSNDGYHLLLADLKTGRTHQIRVHLASIGMPVCGDTIYGKFDCSRLMLHSWKIQIQGLGSNLMTFEAPIPKEFSNIFHNIDEVISGSKI